MLKTFVKWPLESTRPPTHWQGLKPVRGVEDLNLPRSVSRQIIQVVRSLEGRALALWLSGSAARGKLRRSSDIDWVLILKPEHPPPIEEWPTPRHSFHVFRKERFISDLEHGREFAVWQLAYGKAFILDPAFLKELQSVNVPSYESAVRNKRALIQRRRTLIEIRLRSGDFDTVRKELLELLHQEERLRLLSAGIVPGCRSEIYTQMKLALPSEAEKWESFAAKQKQTLTTTSSRAVLTGARAAGITCSP